MYVSFKHSFRCFVPVNSWKEQIQCTRILVVTVTGRGSIPHVTSRVFVVDTFWSVSHGLPRQEHESLMQDGLRIDGKLWPCPSFYTRKSKCLLFEDDGNWLIIWTIGFLYIQFSFYIVYIYIYIHVKLVLLGGCCKNFSSVTTPPGVCPCSSYDDTAVAWRCKIRLCISCLFRITTQGTIT